MKLGRLKNVAGLVSVDALDILSFPTFFLTLAHRVKGLLFKSEYDP